MHADARQRCSVACDREQLQAVTLASLRDFSTKFYEQMSALVEVMMKTRKRVSGGEETQMENVRQDHAWGV